MVELHTRIEQKRKSYVYYVIDVFIYENVASTRAIIENEVVHVSTKIVFDKKMPAAMKYLKFVYSF